MVANKPLDLAIFIKRLMEEQMGLHIDLARSSDMGQRQFDQFEKSVKSSTRKAIDANVRVLSEVDNFTVDLSVLQRPGNKEKSADSK